MKALDAILEIINKQDKPAYRVGVDAGYSRSYIGAAKTQGKTPTVEATARLLGVCGYTLCAVPDDDIPDGALVIDSGDSDESND